MHGIMRSDAISSIGTLIGIVGAGMGFKFFRSCSRSYSVIDTCKSWSRVLFKSYMPIS